MKYHLETDRLIIREIRDTDLEGIFELDSNTEVHKYLGNNPIKTQEEAKKIIKFIRSQYIERGIGRFALIEKKSDEFIGWSGFKLNKGEKETLNGFDNFIMKDYLKHSSTDSDFIDVKFYNDNMIITRVA